MELKELAPWNWFRREHESEGRPLPVVRRPGASMYPATLAQFRNEFDQLFENFLQGFPLAPAAFPSLPRAMGDDGWMKPSVDIAATEKAYAITADLPGVDEKNIDVEISGDTLIIRGQKEHKKEEKNKDYYCVERSYGSFQRQLSLPEDADPEHIEAAYKNGVLSLTVPRRPGKTESAKRIEVHAA